jgi:hypothetical protein
MKMWQAVTDSVLQAYTHSKGKALAGQKVAQQRHRKKPQD